MLVQKGSLRAMRFLTAINLHCPEYLESVSRELWRRIWSKVSSRSKNTNEQFIEHYE